LEDLIDMMKERERRVIYTDASRWSRDVIMILATGPFLLDEMSLGFECDVTIVAEVTAGCCYFFR